MTTNSPTLQDQTKAAINTQILELKKKIQLSGIVILTASDQIFVRTRTVNVCFALMRFSIQADSTLICVLWENGGTKATLLSVGY